MAAVKQNGWALKHIQEQTVEICMVAVQNTGCALAYVKNQTPEICFAAVMKDGYARKHVKKQTTEISSAPAKHPMPEQWFTNKSLMQPKRTQPTKRLRK